MNIIEKPWGREEIIEVNDRYVVKRLTMRRGHRCSLQYHQKKRETVYVLSGRLSVLVGPDPEHLEARIFTAGDWITLEPGMIHRMEGIDDAVYLESSTIELDDVIRIQDDYRRT